MLENVLKILGFAKCHHPNVEGCPSLSYCPDCGKLIKTNWYVIRCECCQKKRLGLLKNGKIYPIAQFCSNCGSKEYSVSKIKNLNYFDLPYAIAKKEEVTENRPICETQSWVDEEEIMETLKLLPKFLN